MANIPLLVTTGGPAGKGETIKSGSSKLNSSIETVNSLSDRITSAEGQLTILSGVPGAIDDIYSKLELTQESISLVVSNSSISELSANVNGPVTSIPVTATAIALDEGDFLEIPNSVTPESPYLFEASAAAPAGSTSISIRPRGGSGPVTIEADSGTAVILDGFTLLAKIELLKGEINSKVSQISFDNLLDDIELLETQISQNATAITLRATKLEVDNIEERLGLAEAAINVNAEAISLAVQQGSATELGELASGVTGTVTSITLTAPIPVDILNAETLLIYNEVTDTFYGLAPNEIYVQGNYLATDAVTTLTINNGTNNVGVAIEAPSGSKVYLSGSALLGKIQVNADKINLSVSADRYIDDLEAVNVGINSSNTYFNGVTQVTVTGAVIANLYAGDEVTLIPIDTNIIRPGGVPGPGELPVRRILANNPVTSGSIYRVGIDNTLAFTQSVQIKGPFVVRLERRGRFGTVASINLNENGVTIEGNQINLIGNAQFSSLQTSVTQAVNTSNNALAQAAQKLNIDFSNASGSTVINGGFIQSGTLALTAFDSGAQNSLVLTSNVIAAINTSTEGFGNLKIIASKLDLQGLVTVSSLNTDIQNNVTTIDGGKISASSRVTVGTAPNVAVLNGSTTNDPTWRIWVGAAAPTSAPFRVSQNGALTATNATLNGSLTAENSLYYSQLAAGNLDMYTKAGNPLTRNNRIFGGYDTMSGVGFISMSSFGGIRTDFGFEVFNGVLYHNGTTQITDIPGPINNPAALLEVASTTRGALLPRMTLTQRNAITTPPAGLIVFNTTNNVYETRDSLSNWRQMSIPFGTTAQRPASPGNGFLYYDSTVDGLFAYSITDGWKQLAFVS